MTPETTPQDAPDASTGTISTCAYCHGIFAASRGWQRFCSKRCRREFHRASAQVPMLERRVARLEAEIKTLSQQNGQLANAVASLASAVAGVSQKEAS